MSGSEPWAAGLAHLKDEARKVLDQTYRALTEQEENDGQDAR